MPGPVSASQPCSGCPLVPTASGPSTVFAIRPQDKSVLNRWVGRTALAVGAPMMTTTGSYLRDQLDLPRTKALGFVKMLQRVPTLLTTSPLNGVVAFGVDQPYHGRRIHELGAGPAPIKRSKLTADRLAELITTLTRPAQAAQWLAGATEARSHLLQELGLEVAAGRLSMLMTNGDPLAWSTSARE